MPGRGSPPRDRRTGRARDKQRKRELGRGRVDGDRRSARSRSRSRELGRDRADGGRYSTRRRSRSRSRSGSYHRDRPRRGAEGVDGGRGAADDTGKERPGHWATASQGHEGTEEDEALPVTLFKPRLMDTFRTNNVVVCTGETGSGKTTQIPQYLLEVQLELEADQKQGAGVGAGAGAGGVNSAGGKAGRPLVVGVTQPRRVAATSVARRVAQQRRCRVGAEVGYSIRFEDCTGPGTRIKYMTDGVLVRECLRDPTLGMYGMIMLDEAHERSINTDILFGLLKRALGLRQDLKVVVTSATLDVDRFAAYFGDCPTVTVPGRTFPVDIYHSKTRQVMTASGPASGSRYVEDAVGVVLQIHRTQGPGHVLLFLTGQDEIERACHQLQEAQPPAPQLQVPHGAGYPPRPEKLLVVRLYGALSGEAQADAFRPAGPGVRKVVVATNIAETSVTVPGVRFVVDPGYVKQKAYDPARRMESLVVVPISQVSAQQRAGRAGRTGPGQCYRLYTRDCYQAMPRETVPEIRRTNLANTVLYLMVLGVEDVLGFDYLDAPDEGQLVEALLHLYCLGALQVDGGVTTTGRRMSSFPLEPSLSRVLLEASELGCLEEALSVVALLSVESLWFTRGRGGAEPGGGAGPGAGGAAGARPGGADEEAEASHARFRHPLGDHLTYLAAYKAWEASGCSDDWAKSSFLRVRALRTARSVRAQLLAQVSKAGLAAKGGANNAGGVRVTSCGRDLDCVCKAFCAGYFMNGGQRCVKGGVYRSLAVPVLPEDAQALKLMHLHPTSALAHAADPPEHVVYTELVFTARPFMRHVLAVKGRWLRNRIGAVGKCSVSRLTGRNGDSSDGTDRASHGVGGVDVTTSATEDAKPAQRDKAAAVAAARERFLARRRAS